MADAVKCDVCGKYSTDAANVRADLDKTDFGPRSVSVEEYDGWWHLQTLRPNPSLMSGSLHELDICSRDCLAKVASGEELARRDA